MDRSAAYAARWVAKNIVAAGLATKCEVQLAYAIGVAHPVSIMVETFGTGKVDDAKLEEAVKAVFDLRPTAIIRDLDLRKPIYRKLAAYGHMGREDLGVSWEKLRPGGGSEGRPGEITNIGQRPKRPDGLSGRLFSKKWLRPLFRKAAPCRAHNLSAYSGQIPHLQGRSIFCHTAAFKKYACGIFFSVGRSGCAARMALGAAAENDFT